MTTQTSCVLNQDLETLRSPRLSAGFEEIQLEAETVLAVLRRLCRLCRALSEAT